MITVICPRCDCLATENAIVCCSCFEQLQAELEKLKKLLAESISYTRMPHGKNIPLLGTGFADRVIEALSESQPKARPRNLSFDIPILPSESKKGE